MRRLRGESYNPAYASIVVDANSGAVMQVEQSRQPAPSRFTHQNHDAVSAVRAAQQGKITLNTELPVSAHAAAQAPPSSASSPAKRSASRPRSARSSPSRPTTSPSWWRKRSAATRPNFAKMMTAKAHALGMTQTIYRNASGLPDDQQITTARDQATLGRAIQDRFPKYYPLFLHPHVRLPRQCDPQPQPSARRGRRRRRHQDRLHPRVRLQHRHLGAPRRPSHRCRGVRRPHRQRARCARASA